MRLFLYIIFAITVGVCNAQEVVIPNSGISFTAPDEFKPLSQEFIDIKWHRKNPPKWAIGNASMKTTIAYDVRDIDISGKPLEETMEIYKNTMTRIIGGLVWKKHEIVEIFGRKWIYFEILTNAVDTEIYNIILITAHGNSMLMFNFNSTKEDFAKYEKALRASIETIKVP
ncbi:MAG: hypothetical protein AB7D29_00020 [Campylobacterales bacterium]